MIVVNRKVQKRRKRRHRPIAESVSGAPFTSTDAYTFIIKHWTDHLIKDLKAKESLRETVKALW